MMKNGFIILLILGAGFAFYTLKFMRSVESEPAKQGYTYTPTEDMLNRYIKESPSGDRVFDPANLDIKKAKELWNLSSLKDGMMELYPKFELMKDYAKLHISRGAFLDLILSKLDEAETKYQTGEANFEEARRIVENL
jgi:hypothetical protein